MELTEKLGLKKPGLTDYVNVADLNDNMDILDEEVGGMGDDLETHKAESTQQAHLAKNIGLEDTAGNFVSTELEGAMSELFTNVSSGKDLVGGAITGIDDSVVIPTDATFQQLANAIGQINTGTKITAGANTLLGSSDSVVVGKSTTWKKRKTLKVNFNGSIKVSFSMQSTFSLYLAKGKIYINDEPVGIEREVNSTGFITYDENFNVKEGDLIQLYTMNVGRYAPDAVNDGEWKNFRIYVDNIFVE